MKYAALLLLATAAFAQSPKRLFIEEHIVEVSNFFTGASDAIAAQNGTPIREHKKDVSAIVTRDILNTCPSAVTITEDPKADYALRILQGASTLYNPSTKDVVKVFSTTKLKTLGKDVCQYFNSAH